MKKFNYILLSILTIFLVFSCGENEMDDVNAIVDGDGTVSGFVTLQWSGQSQADAENFLVYLGETAPSTDLEIDTAFFHTEDQLSGNNWFITSTDSIGYYQFDDVGTFDNWQIHLYYLESSIEAFDNIPDGDLDEEVVGTFINVSVDEDEHDKGNNFEVYIQSYTALSGQVLFEGSSVSAEEHAGLILELYPADENGVTDLDNLIERTQANEAGYYEFVWLESGFYSVVFPYQEDYTVVQSGDTSPDDDPVGNDVTSIPVYLDWYEVDSNNNFTLQKNQNSSVISGHVIIDINNDGQGDIPAQSQRLDLYKRSADGLLTTELIATTETHAEGYYEFKEINLGEYVIQYVGSGLYSCLESMDTSPETSEPINNDCQYISTDLLLEDVDDRDNVFVVVE